MTNFDDEYLATTTRWEALCKDCRADRAAADRHPPDEQQGRKRRSPRAKDGRREQFDYADTSVRQVLERGGSRSDRCPECRKRHRRSISAFPVAYVDVTAIGEAIVIDENLGPTGPLGGLGPLPNVHRSQTSKVDLRDFPMGLQPHHIDELLGKLEGNQVVVLEAGTGTGKSTLAPFRLMNPPAGISYRPTDNGPIVITEPRVVATTENAEFVGESMCFGHDPKKCTKHVGPGYPVGYQCEGNKRWDESCQLIYVTDGSLINWIVNGELGRFSIVVIDEAHERSANIDTILVLLHANLHRYPNLKVLLVSATIKPEFFLDYFADVARGTDCLTVHVKKEVSYGIPLFPGEAFPEEVLSSGLEIDGQHYAGWVDGNTSDGWNLRRTTEGLLALRSQPLASLDSWSGGRAATATADQALRIVKAVNSGLAPSGDVIAFLPGKRECQNAKRQLLRKVATADLPVDVYWLMKETESDEKKAALAPAEPGRLKVIFASNLAETSLTIPGLRYVVDSGLINQPEWQPDVVDVIVPTVLHSRSGVRQRWGRVGRKTYGWVFPLYTKQQFLALQRDTPAGSTQQNLEEVILKLAAAGVTDLSLLKFPANFTTIHRDDADETTADTFTKEVQRATSALQASGALNGVNDLTGFGRELHRSRYSAERTTALLFADRLACVPEVAIALLVLDRGELAGPGRLLRHNWQWPVAWRVQARRCHEALAIGCMDDLDLTLRIVAEWEGVDDQQTWANQWWVDHQVLLQLQKEAITLMRGMAAGMNSVAARPIKLELVDRARAVLSRAMSSQQYAPTTKSGWQSVASSTLKPPASVTIAADRLVPPDGRVVAFSRQRPRPSWGQERSDVAQLEGLVSVVDWACEGEPEPFELMLRAHEQLRYSNQDLERPLDVTQPLRTMYPVGSLLEVRLEADAGGLTRLIAARIVRLGWPFIGDEVPTEGSDAGSASSTATNGKAAVVYRSDSLRSSGSDERWDQLQDWTADSDKFSEIDEFGDTAIDLLTEELDDSGAALASINLAEPLKPTQIVSVGEFYVTSDVEHGDSVSLPEGVAFTALVTGYEQQDDIQGLRLIELTPYVAQRTEPLRHDDLEPGDLIAVVASNLVRGHFQSYLRLIRCDDAGHANGMGEFYYGGPSIEQWDTTVSTRIPIGSRWVARVVPGIRPELTEISLMEDLFVEAADVLQLTERFEEKKRPSKYVDCAVVSTRTVNSEGEDCLVLRPLTTASASQCAIHLFAPVAVVVDGRSLCVGDEVRAKVSIKLRERRSRDWPAEIVERLVHLAADTFKPAKKATNFDLVSDRPLDEQQLALLLQEANGDERLERYAWLLWTSSHFITCAIEKGAADVKLIRKRPVLLEASSEEIDGPINLNNFTFGEVEYDPSPSSHPSLTGPVSDAHMGSLLTQNKPPERRVPVELERWVPAEYEPPQDLPSQRALLTTNVPPATKRQQSGEASVVAVPCNEQNANQSQAKTENGSQGCASAILAIIVVALLATGVGFAWHQLSNQLASQPNVSLVVGQKPRSLELTPDGKRLFVASAGCNDCTDNRLMATISVVDVATRKISIPPISVGKAAPVMDAAMRPDGARLYFLLSHHDGTGGELGYIDTSSFQVTKFPTSIHDPQAIAVSSDGHQVYVIDVDGNLTVFDTDLTRISRVKMGATSPKDVLADHLGRYVYAVAGNKMYQFDLASRKTKSAELATSAQAVSLVELADGSKVYAASADAVSAFDAKSLQFVESVRDLRNVKGMTASADGSRIVILGDNYVAAFPPSNMQKTAQQLDFENDGLPGAVLIGANGSELYILNSADNTLHIVTHT